MPKFTASAYAKVNLTLDVLGKRTDGYHELRMIMQTVNIRDVLTIETGTGRPNRAESGLPWLPADEKNLALLAAMKFFDAAGLDAGGIFISIQKKIPVCAGLGGGSADAAAVLRALSKAVPGALGEDGLMRLALSVGSDVPYCMMGGTMLAEGRGERLKRLPDLPACPVVICKPGFPLSTRAVFSLYDGFPAHGRPDTGAAVRALENSDVPGLARRMKNALEEVVSGKHPEIGAMKAALMECGALGAVMSGSGPAVFGLFDDINRAKRAYHRLKPQYADTFLSETVSSGPAIWGDAARFTAHP